MTEYSQAINTAVSSAFNYGIGEAFQHGTTDLGQFATKTAAHGLSGSVQNAILGGNVGTGFLSGSAGYAAGCVGASLGGDLGGLAGSSLGGGAASAASGGDFGSGAQIGAMGYLFNSMEEWTVNMGVSSLSSVLRSAFQTDFGMGPGQVTEKMYDVSKKHASTFIQKNDLEWKLGKWAATTGIEKLLGKSMVLNIISDVFDPIPLY